MHLRALFNKYRSSDEVRSVATYTFANFFNKGLSFLMLFYFANVLTQSDFGMLSLFNNSILFLMPFVSLGILQSVNTDFFKLSNFEFRNFLTSAIVLPIIVTVASALFLFVFKQNLKAQYALPYFFAWLIPALALMGFLNELLFILFRNNLQANNYLVAHILRLIIEIAIAVILIKFFQLGWLSRVTGVAISFFVIAAYAVFYLMRGKYLGGQLQIGYIKSELIFSLPVMALQLGVFSLSASAVYFLQHFTKNLAEVGVYSVAATFGSIVNVFCVALLQYAQPNLYKLLSASIPDFKAIRRQLVWYIVAMAVSTILVIVLVPLAYMMLLDPGYQKGLSYYYLICLGQFCWSIAYLFCSFLLYYKLKKRLMLFSLAAIALSVIFNYWLIGQWQSKGAALACFLSNAGVLLLIFLIVKKQIIPILQGKAIVQTS
jgi:O-antigen/teichoic acid export membrane protein